MIKQFWIIVSNGCEKYVWTTTLVLLWMLGVCHKEVIVCHLWLISDVCARKILHIVSPAYMKRLHSNECLSGVGRGLFSIFVWAVVCDFINLRRCRVGPQTCDVMRVTHGSYYQFVSLLKFSLSDEWRNKLDYYNIWKLPTSSPFSLATFCSNYFTWTFV